MSRKYWKKKKKEEQDNQDPACDQARVYLWSFAKNNHNMTCDSVNGAARQ